MPPVNKPPLVMRWLPALAMMGVIFLASSLPASDLPFFGRWDVWVKKGGHALGYGLLGLSYFYALPQRLSGGYRRWMAWLMAVVFALSDEFHQSFVEGRGSTLADVGIDSFGAGLSLLLGSAYSSNSDSNAPS
jgi:VanZ family protein